MKLPQFAEAQDRLDNKCMAIPQIARGQVWCVKCGRTQYVNPIVCLHTGWPECCGETMTIDSPDERKRLAAKAGE